MADTGSLAETLARLPAQPIAAVRVVTMIEDPNTSAADLARLIETDPALSARVMRLANAPYYGLTRKVSSAARAVVLLGFSTVRALAVSAACGLLAEQGQLGPQGYWSHSVATAAGASVIARQIGMSTGDAFSAGLLHDLGAALLNREAPAEYERVVRLYESGVAICAAEIEVFGINHAQAGAEVLDGWRFPKSFVRAIAGHHSHPEQMGETLGRVVIAGDVIARMLDDTMPHDTTCELSEVLETLGVPPQRANRIVLDVRHELDTVARFLGVDLDWATAEQIRRVDFYTTLVETQTVRILLRADDFRPSWG